MDDTETHRTSGLHARSSCCIRSSIFRQSSGMGIAIKVRITTLKAVSRHRSHVPLKNFDLQPTKNCYGDSVCIRNRRNQESARYVERSLTDSLSPGIILCRLRVSFPSETPT